MILEVAILHVREEQAGAFEAAFREASGIISSMPGYQSQLWSSGTRSLAVSTTPRGDGPQQVAQYRAQAQLLEDVFCGGR